MTFPIMDHRNSQEILEYIDELAKSYTPEWDFSVENPDFGVVISKIFSDMMAHTINLRNHTPYNHYLTFLNLLNTKALPPIPAAGFITIEVDKNIDDGIYIEKGSLVYASADNEEGKVFYQLTNGIYADKVKIENIICTNGVSDKVVLLDRSENFYAFDTTLSENLQRHILYFSDDIIFNFDGESDISLQFNNSFSQVEHDMLCKEFLKASFEYYSENRWQVIEDVLTEDNNYIRLRFNNHIRPTSIMGKEGLYIRCKFDSIPDKPLRITSMKSKSQGENILPTALSCADNDLTMSDFFPFLENYTINDCFYICCDHVFRKEKAEVTIDWIMDYVKCKSDIEFIPTPIQYKKIMDVTDFEPVLADDISIEKVIWEYYNGSGWVRLFSYDAYSDFFSKNMKGKLSFIVPANIEATTNGGYTGFYIRARITKINNPYSYGGKYISPFVHSIKISYKYNEFEPEIKEIIVDSNLVEKKIIFEQNKNIPLLKSELLPEPTMYLVLSKGIIGESVKILFDMEKSTILKRPNLKWEYFAENQNGLGCWKNINLVDETKDFSTSAVITIIGKKDFYRGEMFGLKGNFIRIVNMDSQYHKFKSTYLPYIKTIGINTVGIIQKINQSTEYFFVETGEKNKTCNLTSENIYDIEVWVDEKDLITDSQMNELIKNELGELEYDSSGQISKAWIKWEETDNLSFYNAGDRVYEVEHIMGNVQFGNGIFGKIPTSKKYETVKVNYSITEGVYGNIGKDEILGFADSIPYISKMKNTKPIIGGVKKESIGEVTNRISAKLSSFDRLVTLEDYEQAILVEDRRVRKVKCKAHVNRFNEKKLGCISIAILPIEYMCGDEQFEAISASIKEHILSRSTVFSNEKSLMDIFETTYVEMNISFSVLISDYDNYHQISGEINNKLEIFLNPITGNFDGNGFEIGNLPNSQSIYNCVIGIKNIKRIEKINIFTDVITKEGKKEIDFTEAKNNIFAVPVFGSVEIDAITVCS